MRTTMGTSDWSGRRVSRVRMDRSSFVLDEHWWTTAVRFVLGSGSPARSAESGSDTAGSVPLVFAPEGRGDEPLTDTEIASVGWTVDNLPRIADALLPALLTHYRSICADPDGLEPDDLPPVASADGLLPLISIRFINVHQISKDGEPYVGFEFDCTWDEEHGLGVLMHGTRVVEVGGADTAFLLWIAEQDSERSAD
jgi:hypothetical protein